ncbi:BspA family leucine-rich repeat surface protein [Psychrobacter sp. H7-1]|uniref:BspA family leucine-rich repeat surface protein n=1 Tax=Psychrobacter sp. H7-1 TaxID=1569265 RepID=UPI001917E436|nr:BspA family leucine-rich repeat surface protein [Psychrobacter sp. H7-1]
MKKLVSHDEFIKFIDEVSVSLVSKIKGLTGPLEELLDRSLVIGSDLTKLSEKTEGIPNIAEAESRVARLEKIHRESGLAKDYPGHGWYKTTDTGVVYNKGVPEGETYIFEGDPTEYLSIHKIPYSRGSSTYLSDMAEHHANLERYATSNMTDMEMMFHFYNSSLMGGNGEPKIVDVSHYDVSNVTNMAGVFQQSENTTFKGVEGWDVSNVTNLDAAFSTSTFNQDIGGWDVSNVVSMESAFNGAREFNQDISKWDVSNVTNMRAMFNSAKNFNQDINNWNTSNVTDMSNMFNGASVFNQDLSQWCVSKITSEPRSFYANASAWILPKPAWGTCPPRGEAKYY